MRLSRRQIAALGAGTAAMVSLAVVIWVLNSVSPPIVGIVTAYTPLQLEAVEQVEALIERGLTASLALTAAFGAAILGFNQKLSLTRTDAVGVAAALYFCVLSSIAGVVGKIRLAEMLGNSASPYLTQPIISLPLSAQLYTMVAALGATAVVIALKALNWTSSGESQ